MCFNEIYFKFNFVKVPRFFYFLVLLKEGLPLKSDLLSSASASAKNQRSSASFNDKKASSQSKSKKLYNSVESVNPLTEGFIHAGDVEDAFRVSYVDFQQDFMEELKDLFFNKFSIELSQIMPPINNIKPGMRFLHMYFNS